MVPLSKRDLISIKRDLLEARKLVQSAADRAKPVELADLEEHVIELDFTERLQVIADRLSVEIDYINSRLPAIPTGPIPELA